MFMRDWNPENNKERKNNTMENYFLNLEVMEKLKKKKKEENAIFFPIIFHG